MKSFQLAYENVFFLDNPYKATKQSVYASGSFVKFVSADEVSKIYKTSNKKLRGELAIDICYCQNLLKFLLHFIKQSQTTSHM